MDEATRKVQIGSPVGSPLPKAKLDGYSFLGWFTAKSGGEQVTPSTIVTKDVTYYAHWKKAPDIVTGGHTPAWTQQSDGTWQSGAITDNQTNWIQKTVSGPGTITFKWKVSSEPDCDKLVFSIDGSRKLVRTGTSQTSFTDATFTVTGSGSHVLRWAYEKDRSWFEGSDCAWVSQIKWTAADATSGAKMVDAKVAAEKSACSAVGEAENSMELFAPGEFMGKFADDEGTFVLMLDEGMETAYLVTYTEYGGDTFECEAIVADDALTLTTETGAVYRLIWDDGCLVAMRVE